MRWIDVTIPMRPSMTVWPGDPPFTMVPAARIADGAGCNVSTLTLSTHTGTHCDAPWHFDDDGKKLHEVSPDIFFGDALIVDLPAVTIIRAPDLPTEKLPPRVLFKTRNSNRPHDAPFMKDYVALDHCAARRCVEDGVRLVGVDYLSVAPYKQDRQETHHILLRANVFVVEGLLLKEFPAGKYPFVVLPMHIVGADGAPCRAFIGQEEHRA